MYNSSKPRWQWHRYLLYFLFLCSWVKTISPQSFWVSGLWNTLPKGAVTGEKKLLSEKKLYSKFWINFIEDSKSVFILVLAQNCSRSRVLTFYQKLFFFYFYFLKNCSEYVNSNSYSKWNLTDKNTFATFITTEPLMKTVTFNLRILCDVTLDCSKNDGEMKKRYSDILLWSKSCKIKLEKHGIYEQMEYKVELKISWKKWNADVKYSFRDLNRTVL